jgi:hypothetical protein
MHTSRHTPWHTSSIRTSTQERGNIYIYLYIKNINIFASHKSSHKHKIHHTGNKYGHDHDMQTLNNKARERVWYKLLPQSHSPRGELLHLHHVAEGDVVDGVKGAIGSGSSCVLIRLKRIYNFWCSMLVYAPFVLCFVTLRGVFMHFLELTYWQDATVTVPCFLLFLCFRKVIQEIFSELDETKPEPPIFPDTRQSPKESRRGARDQPHPRVAPLPLGRTGVRCGPPGPPLTSPLHL